MKGSWIGGNSLAKKEEKIHATVIQGCRSGVAFFLNKFLKYLCSLEKNNAQVEGKEMTKYSLQTATV